MSPESSNLAEIMELLDCFPSSNLSYFHGYLGGGLWYSSVPSDNPNSVRYFHPGPDPNCNWFNGTCALICSRCKQKYYYSRDNDHICEQ